MNSLNILIVDDEEAIGELLFDFFEDLGHSVQLKLSGNEALTLITKEKPQIDAIFSDHRMPKMSGLELFRAVNEMEQYKNTYFFLMSGDTLTAKEDHENFPDINVSLVEKPFREEILKKILDKILTQRD